MTSNADLASHHSPICKLLHCRPLRGRKENEQSQHEITVVDAGGCILQLKDNLKHAVI